MTAEVLTAIAARISGSIGSLPNTEVIVGRAERALDKDSATIRVTVEDAGSGDRPGIDGGVAIDFECEITIETFRPASDAIEVRDLIRGSLRGFYLRRPGLHSGRWDAPGGWDVFDQGRRRLAALVVRSRVYSARAIMERIG